MPPRQNRQIKSDRRQQDTAIGTQQDAGRNRRAGRGPELATSLVERARLCPNRCPTLGTSRMHSIQSSGRAIESERCKEDLQSFGEHGGGIVREERTQRRQDKSDSRRAFGNRPAGKVGNDQAGGQVHQNLRQHDCFEVAGAK